MARTKSNVSPPTKLSAADDATSRSSAVDA
jgi:hypothetical protein